jgi:GrpB-like predicted nucleotidyltransferase (UPF0157 family)
MVLEDPRDVVEVLDHDPEWKHRFEVEKALLERTMGDLVSCLEHIGSTAVPGLPAKPVIDILAGVTKQSPISVYQERVAPLGYEYMRQDDEPQRIHFRKGMPRTHHLHIVIMGTDHFWDHLLFRDYMISHPVERQEYAVLKRDLAKSYTDDREAYWEGKDRFIKSVLRMARYESGPHGSQEIKKE